MATEYERRLQRREEFVSIASRVASLLDDLNSPTADHNHNTIHTKSTWDNLRQTVARANTRGSLLVDTLANAHGRLLDAERRYAANEPADQAAAADDDDDRTTDAPRDAVLMVEEAERAAVERMERLVRAKEQGASLLRRAVSSGAGAVPDAGAAASADSRLSKLEAEHDKLKVRNAKLQARNGKLEEKLAQRSKRSEREGADAAADAVKAALSSAQVERDALRWRVDELEEAEARGRELMRLKSRELDALTLENDRLRRQIDKREATRLKSRELDAVTPENDRLRRQIEKPIEETPSRLQEAVSAPSTPLAHDCSEVSIALLTRELAEAERSEADASALSACATSYLADVASAVPSSMAVGGACGAGSSTANSADVVAAERAASHALAELADAREQLQAERASSDHLRREISELRASNNDGAVQGSPSAAAPAISDDGDREGVTWAASDAAIHAAMDAEERAEKAIALSRRLEDRCAELEMERDAALTKVAERSPSGDAAREASSEQLGLVSMLREELERQRAVRLAAAANSTTAADARRQIADAARSLRVRVVGMLGGVPPPPPPPLGEVIQRNHGRNVESEALAVELSELCRLSELCVSTATNSAATMVRAARAAEAKLAEHAAANAASERGGVVSMRAAPPISRASSLPGLAQAHAALLQRMLEAASSELAAPATQADVAPRSAEPPRMEVEVRSLGLGAAARREEASAAHAGSSEPADVDVKSMANMTVIEGAPAASDADIAEELAPSSSPPFQRRRVSTSSAEGSAPSSSPPFQRRRVSSSSATPSRPTGLSSRPLSESNARARGGWSPSAAGELRTLGGGKAFTRSDSESWGSYYKNRHAKPPQGGWAAAVSASMELSPVPRAMGLSPVPRAYAPAPRLQFGAHSGTLDAAVVTPIRPLSRTGTAVRHAVSTSSICSNV